MEQRLMQRKEQAQAALKSFEKVLTISNAEQAVENVNRDATILRFQFTFEAVWKFAKAYLKLHEGFEENSPKAVIRACFKSHLLDEKQTELMLQMADDRNLAIHTYNEKLADELFARLASHYQVLNDLFKTISDKYNIA